MRDPTSPRVGMFNLAAKSVKRAEQEPNFGIAGLD